MTPHTKAWRSDELLTPTRSTIHVSKAHVHVRPPPGHLPHSCATAFAMVSAPASRAATLLFCHGGGFCKEVWNPIISRLQQSPMVKKAAPTMVSFDFPYHGSKRDVSQPATFHLQNPQLPRVSHVAMDYTKWAKEEVQRQVGLLREKDVEGKRSPVIGVGHSMGAVALWATEAENPGTFDGLILFEPMVNLEEYAPGLVDQAVTFLVSITLKRTTNWESFEEAEADLLSTRNFARWDRDSLKSYIKGAVVKATPENNVIDPDAKWVLSCHPHIEAGLYSGSTLRLSEEKMAGVKGPITFVYGGKSVLFLPQYKQPLVDKYPHLYWLAAPVPNTTHALVMEEPDIIVSRILDSLGQLPPFVTESRL